MCSTTQVIMLLCAIFRAPNLHFLVKITTEMCSIQRFTLLPVKNLTENGQKLTKIEYFLLSSRSSPAFPHPSLIEILLPLPDHSLSLMVRGRPLSDDLRRALLNMTKYLDIPTIHRYTGCPIRTIERLLTDWRKHHTISRDLTARRRGGHKHALSRTDIHLLLGHLDHSPDLYLDEMRDILGTRAGIEVNKSTIWRALSRRGFTMKKLTRNALERNEVKRSLYQLQYGKLYTPEQIVFVDESSFDRRTAIRGRAWALTGKQATRKCFFVRGRR